jgi:hypothetical protein
MLIMRYAELDNLAIVTIHDELPASWRNISGLRNLPDDELADLSWSGNGGAAFYPVVEGSQPSHDPKMQTLIYEDTVDSNARVVNRTWSAVSYSQDRIDAEWTRLRTIRNSRLKACDFTQLADAPLTVQEKSDWTTYRQALRDLPQNTVNPFDATFPTPPSP